MVLKKLYKKVKHQSQNFLKQKVIVSVKSFQIGHILT